MEAAETNEEVKQRQDENTAALVMNTFYKVVSDEGATAEDVTKYLLDKFGDLWQVTTLTTKTEEALKRNAAEGLLEQQGDRFIARLSRETACGCQRKRRRRRSCGRVRKRRRSCGRVRKRRRRSCRRRRKKPCCCKKPFI